MLVTHIVRFILCEYKLEPIAMQIPSMFTFDIINIKLQDCINAYNTWGCVSAILCFYIWKLLDKQLKSWIELV